MADVTLPANLLQEFQDAETALDAALATDAQVKTKQDAVTAAQVDLTTTLTQANTQHSDANSKAQKLLDDLRSHFQLATGPVNPPAPVAPPAPPAV
jgi:hypothetical protein